VECQDWVGLSIKFLEGAWARRADDEVCFDFDLTPRQVEHSSHVPKALQFCSHMDEYGSVEAHNQTWQDRPALSCAVFCYRSFRSTARRVVTRRRAKVFLSKNQNFSISIFKEYSRSTP